MQDDEFGLDKELADDPDYLAMSPAQRSKLLSIMEKMIDMGMAAVYGDEAAGVPDARGDCARCLPFCKARCCTLVFALTREEVARGHILHNPQRPYFVARDADGFCPHLDRQSLRCLVWEERPLRCRRYDCRDDRNIWPDGVPAELVTAFPGLAPGAHS